MNLLYRRGGTLTQATALILLASAGEALAQRTNENATASAEDAFGTSVGNERVGLYSTSEVRGFSPITAGNIRLNGLYYDRPAGFTDRMVENSVIRVGPTAQNYLFPAPTGIVEFQPRPSGNAHVLSTLFGYGTLGGGRIEVDGQMPLIADTLSVAGGIAGYLDEQPSGGDGKTLSYGLVPRWKPAEGVEVIPFWGRVDYYDLDPTPLYVSAGTFLPAPVKRRHYVGPDWAKIRSSNSNYGLISHADLGEHWKLSGGLFRSLAQTDNGHAFVFADIAADGTARRLITADPARHTRSDSGEVRLSRGWQNTRLRQALHLSARARDRQAVYGGGQTFDAGRDDIRAPIDIDRPDFAFSARTRDQVRQQLYGLAYEGQWLNRGSVNLGIQHVEYRKTVRQPDAAPVSAHDRPLLYNAAAAWQWSPRLALYASYTRGLEESGVAPDFAANRNEALPAIQTRQSDAGLRLVLPNDMRLVAGLFDVRKPYFSTNEDNVQTVMGDVRHAGVELSLAGNLGDRFAIVAGAVLMNPEVSGEPVDNGSIGRRPVGQTRRLLTLSGNYTLEQVPGLALTMNVNYHSGRTADRSNRVETPAVAVLDLGARHRFRLGGKSAMLRFQMTNVTDEFDWKVVGNGSYELNAPRSFTLFLTIDH